MTAEKKYTERDLVMAKREGWDEAAYQISYVGRGSRESNAKRDATFPLPKVTRPRVVVDAYGNAYKIERGNLHLRHGGVGKWEFILHVTGNGDALLDLLANPTEEVEDDA